MFNGFLNDKPERIVTITWILAILVFSVMGKVFKLGDGFVFVTVIGSGLCVGIPLTVWKAWHNEQIVARREQRPQRSISSLLFDPSGPGVSGPLPQVASSPVHKTRHRFYSWIALVAVVFLVIGCVALADDHPRTALLVGLIGVLLCGPPTALVAYVHRRQRP